MSFFTKNKMIGGLIGLIAVVGFINTQAIIILTNRVMGGNNNSLSLKGAGQEAQVSLAGAAAKTCVEVLPHEDKQHSIVYTAENIAEITNLEGFNHFVTQTKIKNICNVPIYIVGGYGTENKYFPSSSPIEYSGYRNYKFETFVPQNDDFAEAYGVQSMFTPLVPFVQDDEMAYYLDEHILDVNQNYFRLEPNAVRNFSLHVSAGWFNNSEEMDHHTRMVLDKVNWFFATNLNDGDVSQSNIRTHFVQPSNAALTSYGYLKSYYYNPYGSDGMNQPPLSKNNSQVFQKMINTVSQANINIRR